MAVIYVTWRFVARRAALDAVRKICCEIHDPSPREIDCTAFTYKQALYLEMREHGEGEDTAVRALRVFNLVFYAKLGIAPAQIEDRLN